MADIKIKQGTLGEIRPQLVTETLEILYQIRRELFELNDLQEALDLIQELIMDEGEKMDAR